MVSLPCISAIIHLPRAPFFCKSTSTQFKFKNSQIPISVKVTNTISNSFNVESRTQNFRTLFPGGSKRPEIRLPTLVLRLNADEVLIGEDALRFVDIAVSKWVGIVVLEGGETTGGRLYEAACALKSVVRDRAYILIAERVDIASAVGANGVLLSDQGIPPVVARNMFTESKSETVFLPLVGRIVQTMDSAFIASNTEGADFLVFISGERFTEVQESSVFQDVSVPIFTVPGLLGGNAIFTTALNLLKLGSSGLILSLKDMKSLGDDVLNQLLSASYLVNNKKGESSECRKIISREFCEQKRFHEYNDFQEKQKKLIEREKVLLQEAISVIQKASPMMEEISLLMDATSHLEQPFLLVIVGEFNSGKSSVINAILGKKYLKEGVVPTTNEITLLCYSEKNSSEETRCERHPDGQTICYLSAPILKEINFVDTPGTNVILQRQQKLTEEFVPRADLILFVMSADRPLTESEICFLRYIQQWKKKVVFVLNKFDTYRSRNELEEAIAFIKENIRTLLNSENFMLYPVSARFALDAKLSASLDDGKYDKDILLSDPLWESSGFYELENYLLSFLDQSTSNGMERMRLKLETPVAIASRLLTSCEAVVRKQHEYANEDLLALKEVISSVNEFAMKMERESISWKKQLLALIDSAKSRSVKLIESTFQLSNLDLLTTYILKEGKSNLMPVSSRIQNEILNPAMVDSQRLLEEYLTWLRSNTSHERSLYKESFDKRWHVTVDLQASISSQGHNIVEGNDVSIQVIKNFSPSAAAKLFEQEVKEVVFRTFGGLGAAGLSASLLTSVLPTTMEDLLALGLCSAGGLLAISTFPTRRREVKDKVKRVAEGLARELEEAMRKDLLATIEDLKGYVEYLCKPSQDEALDRLHRWSQIQDELAMVQEKFRILQIEIQNLHIH